MRLAKLLLFLSLAFPTFSIVSAGTDFCIQGGLPPTQDECPTGHHWDNQACRWLCNADVNCFVNPCDIAAAKNICPLKSCVADYSHGCNFKCSKCSQTCANKKCPRGTECVQDDECNRTCQPKTNSCIQGGAPPAECSAEGQYEWDNKACKWQCKCRSNEGNWVSIGDQYYSQCNSCQCLGNGQSICTKKGCLDTCFDDQGKGYNINDTIKQNCNTCTCASNGQWGCTKMACPIATTPEPRQCIQGGPVPDVCSEEGQYHWDSKTCRFICNQPVNCLIDPCDNAVRDGLCTREACVADYWTGCNFICNANTTAPTAAPTSSGPDRCIQGGAPPAECSAPGQYEWDNKACRWQCKNPVNCLIDPCQNADRDGVCPKKFCTADYSQGCNFKCSKCSLTCATVKCPGGTECVQDDECKVQCRPLPTAAPTSSGPNVCIQGGAPPAECSGPGQFEWDNKACRWQCKCRSNEGNWVSIGDQYKYKCNSCQCAAGGQPGICTKMGCTATCYDDQGNGYAQGDTRKQDCNTCTCGRDGNWACTEMACSTPTPAPPGPDMCIQGGQVPPECPTTNVWDSKACQFVCVPPPSHCSTSCASTTCLTGTVCEQDQDCNVMCTSRCPDLCPSGICGAGAACVMNHETCSAECKPTECQDVCTSNTCSKGKACRMIVNALDQCETQCFTTNGIIVLSATFRVTMTRRSNTIDDVYSAMRRIAADAGADVLAALVISNDNIIKKSGNSINYQWIVKIGIKGATSTERQALLSRYIATATNTLKQAQTANADDNTAATVDSEAALTTEETMMAMQSCPDGSEISVADQCPVSTLAVPAASSSSSSSSTPLVAIIVPIVAGVVLIAVIATAVVIIRRRANTIKSMTNVQQETQMAQRV